ncbi:hypothetical protein [Streptomyces sp. NPDC005731]|uniref:hypothetical protein n=1 Tax=Streptomyces sp. NPDC005731 TaxID=3157056 RepID=UPI00340F1CB0
MRFFFDELAGQLRDGRKLKDKLKISAYQPSRHLVDPRPAGSSPHNKAGERAIRGRAPREAKAGAYRIALSWF